MVFARFFLLFQGNQGIQQPNGLGGVCVKSVNDVCSLLKGEGECEQTLLLSHCWRVGKERESLKARGMRT